MIGKFFLVAAVLATVSSAFANSFLVYATTDQAGIGDQVDTPLTTMTNIAFDTGGEWDNVNQLWRPNISAPTVVHFGIHVSWGVPSPPLPLSPGYGKCYMVRNKGKISELDLSEGSVDGPLSVANPRIAYTFQWLAQPGDVFVPSCWFANGKFGHTVQGNVDMRSHVWGWW